MKTVRVIPLKKGVFKEELTYFSAKEIQKGDIVEISVRNKKILGLVISTEEIEESKTDIKNLNFNLKKIIDVKEKSVFLYKYLEAALLTGKYFAAPKNTSVSALIPAVFLESYDKISQTVETVGKTSDNISPPSTIKNEKLLFQNQLEDRLSFYKTLIRGSFAKKKSIFLVLPTENDINNFYEELSKGIEAFTIAIHGNLSPKKQLEKFEQIVSQEHPVLIIGTVPYLSIPRIDLESIILEHESSNAYKMIAPPHFDLRIFTEIYASKINAKFILGDSLLRYETIARKELDNLSEVRLLSFRTNFEGTIEIIDKKPTRNEFSSDKTGAEKFKILNDESLTEIQKTLTKKENIFIFSLRKGLATMTVCNDCGEILMCKNCRAPIVLYLSRDKKKRMFICNRCKNQIDPKTICPTCGSWNLVPLGIGTDTVYKEVKKNLPEVEIFQLDKEVVKTNTEAQKIIKKFEENGGSVLIGTEMAVPYFKNKVPLSIIASFDSLWSIPNFKMGERIIQLVLSILTKTKKKLIIQTKNKEDRALIALETENLASFIREEIQDRKNFEYPPFKRFIKITFVGNKEETLKTKNIFLELFKEYNPLIFSGFVAKQKDKYITNALIKIDPKKWSLPELLANSIIDTNLSEKIASLPPNFSINIDPEDLL